MNGLDVRITVIPITEYLDGVFVGEDCSHCINTSTVVYAMGNCTMTLCDECRMSAV